MRIIVCTDGSDTSRRAVKRAAQVNDFVPEAEITLVFVHEYSQNPPRYGHIARDGVRKPPEGLPSDIDEIYIQQGEEVLEEAIKILKEEGCTCSTRLLHGDPAQAIIAYAKEKECDLLILGSKGRRTIQKIMTGSVSSAVVPKAHCDVLVVK